MANRKKQKRHQKSRRSRRYTSLFHLWKLYNKYPVIEKRGVELDTLGELSLNDCKNVQYILYKNGITASIPKRGKGDKKYYTVYIPNYCKTKIWEILHPFAVEEGRRSRKRLLAQDTVGHSGKTKV